MGKEPDIKKALAVALEAADLADEIMMRSFRKDFKTFIKENASCTSEAILTEIDLECDKVIVRHLKKQIPGSVVVSEESYHKLKGDWHLKDWIWYVDPIDGSFSYMQGGQCFGTSIALTYKGEPVLGVVTNPAADLKAWGSKEYGSFLNGSKLSFSKPDSESPVLLLGPGQYAGPSYQRALEKLQPDKVLIKRSQVRKALMIMDDQGDYTFSFPSEVFNGFSLNYWDIAAAVAIFKASGAVATDLYGAEINFSGPDVKLRQGHFLSSPGVYRFVRKQLDQLIEERRAFGITLHPVSSDKN